MSIISQLTKPERLYSYSDVLSSNCPDLKERGIYAWYFKDIPPRVPTDGCLVKDGKTLLYVGKSSSSALQGRIKKHYEKTARRSTLRMSLGVLLYGQDSTPLRMMSKDDCDHFSLLPDYEKKLSAWMNENAFVCWVATENSVSDEKIAIKEARPPFNILGGCHAFRKTLNQKRTDAKDKARKLEPLE